MNDKDDRSTLKEPDMYNFEKRLREALHELSLKRGLLEESRKELNQAFLVKYELERRLDRACREVEESRVQLELAVSAGRKWEEEREAVPLHRAHLQAALTERDSLKEEARSLQLENIKLRRKIEELEGQLHCLSTFQTTSNVLQSKVEETIREIKRQVQSLIQDHKRLERSVKASSNMSNRLELATRHFNCVHEKMTVQLLNMEAKTVSLASELDTLKNDKGTDSLSEQRTQQPRGIFSNDWKSSLHEMESRLQASEECKNKLQKALQSALQASEKFHKETQTKEMENKELKDAKNAAELQLKELKEKINERKQENKDEGVQVDMPLNKTLQIHTQERSTVEEMAKTENEEGTEKKTDEE